MDGADVPNNIQEICDKIIEAAREVFTGMAMMDISVAGKPLTTLGPLKESITGMVGLAGVYRGLVAVHFPIPVALKVTDNFLDTKTEDINEDVQDAVGEIANMLGGSLKAILSDRGKDIELSLPSTIYGSQYAIVPQADVDQVAIPFQTSSGIFYVEVDLER